jgi:hypothetical protein
MVDIDRKSSTMNSIHAGSTLDKPNVDLIINAVATILHSQMLEVWLLKVNHDYRIKVKARPFPKIVIYSSSQRRNIS